MLGCGNSILLCFLLKYLLVRDQSGSIYRWDVTLSAIQCKILQQNRANDEINLFGREGQMKPQWSVWTMAEAECWTHSGPSFVYVSKIPSNSVKRIKLSFKILRAELRVFWVQMKGKSWWDSARVSVAPNSAAASPQPEAPAAAQDHKSSLCSDG